VGVPGSVEADRMAYANHWLMAIGGTLGNTGGANEIWQCGIRGLPNPGSGLSLGDADQGLSKIHEAVRAWFVSDNANMRNDATIAYCKLNEIGPDGRYVDPTTNVYDYPDGTFGAAVPEMPSFLSVAFSWTTDRNRGPGARGRIYPPVAIPHSPGDVVSTLLTNAYVTAAKGLLDAISNPSSGIFVMGPAVVSKIGAVIQPITGVRVGNVIDVQRRRKNALVEVYATSDWP